jgi:predicted lipoprotein with Yx(FWY)xxD motif
MNTTPRSPWRPAHLAALLAGAAGAFGASVSLALVAAPALARSHPSALMRMASPARARVSGRHIHTRHHRLGARLGVHHSRVGAVLSSPAGHTLYIFARDHGGRSSCYGGCAAIWPALLTAGQPRAGKGVKGRLLGTTRRREGKLQVTYDHHPVYTYAGDSAPGQTNGEGIESFGGRWYALSPSGHTIRRG